MIRTLNRLGRGTGISGAIPLGLLGLGCIPAWAQAPVPEPPPTVQDSAVVQAPPIPVAPTSLGQQNGQVELRRENAERGDPEQSTRTTLRFEAFREGVITRLRLDLPFPDEKTDFGGDPFNPRMGDIRLRATFHSFVWRDSYYVPDIEVTLPTASSPSNGSGKYQVSGCIGSSFLARPTSKGEDAHELRYEWQVRQTFSVAGDSDRKRINKAIPEFGLRDTLGPRVSLKLNLISTIDWTQNAKTGGNLEFEAGWNIDGAWHASIKGGARVWGHDVPGIYGRCIELVIGRVF